MAHLVLTAFPASGGRLQWWLMRLVLVAVLAAGHTIAPAAPPLADHAGNGAVGQGSMNEVSVTRLFNDVLSRNAKGICALLMSADSITHTPVGTFAGPEGFEQFVDEVWSAFPDATFSIGELVATNDQVTVRWTMTGQHLGSFENINASGANVRLDGVAVLRFADGMIVETWLQYDRMALIEQIEAVLERPEVCPPCYTP